MWGNWSAANWNFRPTSSGACLLHPVGRTWNRCPAAVKHFLCSFNLLKWNKLGYLRKNFRLQLLVGKNNMVLYWFNTFRQFTLDSISLWLDILLFDQVKDETFMWSLHFPETNTGIPGSKLCPWSIQSRATNKARRGIGRVKVMNSCQVYRK